MKKYFTQVLLILCGIFIGCDRDEPEKARQASDVKIDGLLEVADDYSPLYASSLDDLMEVWKTDAALAEQVRLASSKEEFLDLFDESMNQILLQTIGDLENTLGEPLANTSSTSRETYYRYELKNAAACPPDEGGFLGKLTGKLDSTSTATTDHKGWSDLIIVSQAFPSSASSDPDSYLIDFDQTKRIYEEKIKPRIDLIVEDEGERDEFIQELFLANEEPEGIVAALLLPAIIHNREAARRNQGTGETDGITQLISLLNETDNQIQFDYIFSAINDRVEDAVFYGLVYGSYPLPTISDCESANCSLVSMYTSALYATMYYMLDEIWELTHQEGLNIGAVLNDGNAYGDVYGQAMNSTYSLLSTNTSLISELSSAQDETDFFEIAQGYILPPALDFLSSFQSSEGQTAMPASVAANQLNEFSLTIDTQDGGELFEQNLADLVRTQSDAGTASSAGQVPYYRYELKNVVSTGLPDFSTFQSTYSNIDLEVIVADESQILLRETLFELKGDGSTAAQYFPPMVFGLLLPAVQAAPVDPNIKNLVIQMLGEEPDDLDAEIASWSETSINVALYGFTYSLYATDLYNCDDLHCLLTNAYYEAYTASSYFILQQVWEYVDSKKKEALIDNLLAHSEIYRTLVNDALMRSFQTLNDIDIVNGIVAESETYADFLQNVNDITENDFLQEVGLLSQQAGQPLPLSQSNLKTLIEVLGSTRDVRADLPVYLDLLASQREETSTWVSTLIDGNTDGGVQASGGINELIKLQQLKGYLLDLDLSTLADDETNGLLKETMKDLLEADRGTEPLMSILLVPVFYDVRPSSQREVDIKEFMEKALDAAVLPGADDRIAAWNDELSKEMLAYGMLYAFLNEDTYQCEDNLECIYSNMYNEMYLTSYYYLLGKIWSYMEEVQG